MTMQRKTPKIEIISKKLSQMTTSELIQESSLSESNATKVAQLAWNSSVGRANEIYRGLSELNTVANNLEARRFILSFIERNGLGGPGIDTLANILSSEPKNQETQLLHSISIKYKDTIAPAILMTAKGTPDALVDILAKDTGLAGQVYADNVETRAKTLSMIERVIENTGKWENERSGIFLSKAFMQKPINEFKAIIHNLSTIPYWFLLGVGTEGSKEQKEAITDSQSPEVMSKIMEMQFAGTWPVKPGEDKNKLFLNWIKSSKISPEVKLAKFEEIYPSLDEDTKSELVKELARMPNRNIYNKILKMFENGETNEVEAITGNLSFSISNFSKLLRIMRDRGLLSRADPDFMSFVQRMTSRRN